MSAVELNVENALTFLAERGYSLMNSNVRNVMKLGEEVNEQTLCEGLKGVYSLGLHVGSIFLILGVSFLGTAIPILSKCVPFLRRMPFVFTVAKTAATGVLLSVSTIHLIHEGAEAFTEECMNATLKQYEPAYFLFALVAVLLMQMLDIQLGEIAEGWLKRQSAADAAELDAVNNDSNELTNDEARVGESAEGSENEPIVAAKPKGNDTAMATVEDDEVVYLQPNAECDHVKKGGDCDAHGHQHLAVRVPRDMGSIRRVISAICMEFGVTLHSLFVGLAIGLTTDTELKPLLVALVFHQLFEGMAMGSRLADAEFKGSLEIILALVFAVSAPIGMAAATIAVSVSRDAMSGTGFVTLTGVLDSFCGGILLYLAFTLLLGDFVADMKHYCAAGQPYRIAKKIGLFVALWAGMGLMALVGNWL